LCEAVTGLAGPACAGQACLEQLERENLFTTSLDGRREWFRYQHLFQQFLLNRLERHASAAEIAGLHARASAWYAANGNVEDAISHALKAGDEEAVVRLIEAHRHPAMNQEHWQQLERWLRLIPRRLINQHPQLLLSEAWILQRQWRLADLPPYLARIEALMEQAPAPEPAASLLCGEVDALHCLVSYLALDGESAYTFARHSLQALPLDYSSVRGVAWMYYAGGLQAMGDVKAAYNALDTALKEDRFHGNAFPARVLIALCMLNWMTGDLGSLGQVADRYLKLAGERNLAESIGWARYFRACAAYQANDLASAEVDFAAVVEQRYLAHGFPFSQSAVGLASIWLARGAPGQARAVIESVLEYGLETGNTRVLAEVRAFQAYLALAEGRRAEAQRWVDSVDRRAPLAPMTTFTSWNFYLARILLDQRTPASLAEAAEVLARLHDFVETTPNTRFKIEVLALQALLDDALGHQGAASATLQEAVALARPGGVQRVFLDLGPGMASLLGRLSPQGADSTFVARLLRGFPPPEPHALPPAPASQARLIEPLTDRELEVLALLVQRLSAKEIAERLVISDRTVKRHTANIYQKLGVNSRRQAAAQATALNLPIPISPRIPQ
jgi:LuxR family maltose regulon positive regulatory protein